MFTFVIFIISLALLIFLFIMKSLEINRGRKIFLERQFENFDAWILKVILKIKFWWSHVSFRNLGKISLWLVTNIKSSIVALKKRFDHEQSHFFSKREPKAPNSKGSVSFFLKDVSDYKRKLREGRKE